MLRTITALMLCAACSWGQVMKWNGGSQYASMGDVLDLGTQDATLAAWVKTTDTGYSAIMGKAILTGSATPKGYGVSLDTDGSVYAELRNGGTLYTADSPDAINDGAWHHIAAVIDRSETDGLRIFVDGELKNTTDISAAVSEDFQCVHLFAVGARDDNGLGSWLWYFDGSIDDPRVYSTALTSNRIARLVLDTCEMYRPDFWTNATLHSYAETWDTGYGNTNLAGAWRGDHTGYGNGNSFTNVPDLSGNGNDGTAYNNPTIEAAR